MSLRSLDNRLRRIEQWVKPKREWKLIIIDLYDPSYKGEGWVESTRRFYSLKKACPRDLWEKALLAAVNADPRSEMVVAVTKKETVERIEDFLKLTDFDVGNVPMIDPKEIRAIRES